MKIVFFDDRADFNLGAQRNLLLLAREVSQTHEVVVFSTAPGVFLKTASDLGLETRVCQAPEFLRSVESGHYFGSPVRVARSLYHATAYQNKIHKAVGDVDAVVTSNLRSSLLLLRARVSGTSLITYVQNDLPLGWWAAVAGTASSRLGMISESCSGAFPSWYRGRVSKKSFPLPSGREMPAGTASMTAGLRLVCVASLTERKGQMRLLDALDKLRERGISASLSLVGGTTDDPDSAIYFDQLTAVAKRDSHDVDFVGWTDDVESHLLSSDVFVLASRNEGLPGVILEAMGAGLPVVAMDAGGIADAVVHGHTGFVVPQGNVEAMTDRIAELNDPDLRRTMGATSRAVAEENYSLEVFGKRLLDQLERI